MDWIILAAVAWIAIWAFNVREGCIHWLDEFGSFTRADLAFFVIMGAMGPAGALLPLAWFIKRKTNFRIDWDKPVATKRQ